MAHIEKTLVNGVITEITQLDHSAEQVDDAVGRALPGGDIETQLSTKAAVLPNASPESTGCQTLLEYIAQLYPAGPRVVYLAVGAFKDLPRQDWSYQAKICMLGGTVVVTIEKILSNGSERYFRESNTLTNWNGDWVLCATATKPQELALPLEVGVAATRNTYYIKEQNGRVKVYFCVGFGQSGGRIKAIAKLPPGYLPASVETNSCIMVTSPGDAMMSGIVEVLPDGVVQVYANASGFTKTTGSIEFSATH